MNLSISVPVIAEPKLSQDELNEIAFDLARARIASTISKALKRINWDLKGFKIEANMAESDIFRAFDVYTKERHTRFAFSVNIKAKLDSRSGESVRVSLTHNVPISLTMKDQDLIKLVVETSNGLLTHAEAVLKSYSIKHEKSEK